ncbi:MAG: 16S rRNA (adenine(1518)-N(6)/adenine(1519)-N(6))-dimethyltransferase, partial [Quisquiliibacterium sp.]
PQLLSEVLAAAFGQRRKMLRNTLLPWLSQLGVEASELAPTQRPENLSVQTYVDLAIRLGRARS